MKKKASHIDISERKLLLKIGDIFLLVLSLWVSNLFLSFDYVNFQNPNIVSWVVILSIYILLFGEIFQLYNLDVSNNRFLVTRSIVIATFTTTILYVFTPFIVPELPENRLQIIYFFLIITIPIILWRFIYISLFFSPKYFKDILILGHSSRLTKLLNLVHEKGFHNISAYVSESEVENFSRFQDIDNVNLQELVTKNTVTEIIISTTGLSANTIIKVNNQLIQLFEKGINIKSYESFYEEITDRVPKEYLDYHFYKNFNLSKNNSNRLYNFLNRALDVLISSLGLLFFFCTIPLIFVANLFGNNGPLFYSQVRVGQNGKEFKILKLRSMVVNAEKNGAVWAEKNDTRITGFGKFLRKTRFDELPQFYNILKGDMSLIGPRPERPEFVEGLQNKIPFYAIRHVIRPGLTGWAQVNYPYASTMEEQETKLRYDLFYIKERNSFLDFKIIIKTITTVLFFKGQ
jgi:exopolysaccharide biosynthesis polyprenyl glycosylphosphotransferase